MGGLCPWGCLCPGGCLCTGGSLSGKGLCPGAEGGSLVRETPPYGNMRGVSYWNAFLFFVILDSQPQG